MEKNIIINAEYELAGILAFPDDNRDKYKAVLIIGGSGEFDMDGNMKDLPLSTYKKLADMLVEFGYLSLRYNKRGINGSGGVYLESGVDDFISDIEEALEYLLNLDNVDKENIFILGHSEGAILSTIYQKHKSEIHGKILLSGGGVDIRTAQMRQYEVAKKELNEISGFRGKVIRQIINGEKLIKKQLQTYERVLETEDSIIKADKKKIPAKWMREHLKINQEKIIELLAEETADVLIVSGTKDIQSSQEDLNKVSGLKKKNIEIISIENMDHMLREYTGKKTMINQKKQYMEDADKPLHEDLVSLIKDWLE